MQGADGRDKPGYITGGGLFVVSSYSWYIKQCLYEIISAVSGLVTNTRSKVLPRPGVCSAASRPSRPTRAAIVDTPVLSASRNVERSVRYVRRLAGWCIRVLCRFSFSRRAMPDAEDGDRTTRREGLRIHR